MLELSCVQLSVGLELPGEESFGFVQETTSTHSLEVKPHTPAMGTGKAGVNKKPFYKV